MHLQISVWNTVFCNDNNQFTIERIYNFLFSFYITKNHLTGELVSQRHRYHVCRMPSRCAGGLQLWMCVEVPHLSQPAAHRKNFPTWEEFRLLKEKSLLRLRFSDVWGFISLLRRTATTAPGVIVEVQWTDTNRSPVAQVSLH